ncbi:Sterol 3-beta-glucosyltransferase UGT80B1 [Cyphellophora attinorum]|uniref:Sterol 3-beta-glucosyltransferase UGT80B1 n=1 Tax=Cyphellophora attinorum TaxID=1664694 RepID=A0A0N1P004_9EURO|nr:Sterol 3-beta-glucosyltransferase UGT80B1 [Phialophora attinorum]KPI39480.1 Sterol 3-beta-glucosyltransferase UGT80B1 [Phialophora attinorum]
MTLVSPTGTSAVDYADDATATGLRRPSSATRLDSEATLQEVASDPLFPGIESPFTPVDRPNVLARAATDAATPVAIRPVLSQSHRKSTGAAVTLTHDNVPIMEATAEAQESPSEDSDSDDNGAPLQISKSHTAPAQGHPLGTRRLNKVKRENGNGKRDVQVGNEHFQGRGRVARDGRLRISVNETVAKSGYLSKALGTTITRHLHPEAREEEAEALRHAAAFHESQAKGTLQIPSLNIVIMVIGSRGDIQPFLKIGKILKDKYNHRVRIATHPTFKKFIEEEIGLEFFSIKGDPSRLMAFMVKNPGLIPSLDTIKAGEIGERRQDMFEMFQGMWRACINATDDEHDLMNLKMMGDKYPFIADAIIANPPSMAHVHIAEKLGIPLHLCFPFPFHTPTSQFPHPLANIKSSNVEDMRYINYMSYPLVDLMTWQGLGDLVNKFRQKTLNLEPVSTLWAPGQLSRLKIPVTYLWSPGFVPKPADWGPEIDIAGYVFLDLATSYKPPDDLVKFLERSSDKRPLLYIGFGSISGIDDPTAFTQMIFDGVAKADVRAVISKGWGDMGKGMDKPDGVFMIDNVPHDWLFQYVDAVVHHGGAGTTAAGLKAGKPTMIVPFFGDQPFWAKEIAKVGAGAKEALPLKKLDSDKFAKGIRECLEPDAKAKAQEIAKSIAKEGDGAENAVDSFHRSLPLAKMRCGVFSDRLAIWTMKHTKLQLSALAADLLIENKQLQWQQLILHKSRVWKDFQGPGEPLTGIGGVVVNAFQEAFSGLSEIKDTTTRDVAKRKKKKRKQQGLSIEDAVTLPGRYAHAMRGETAENAKEDYRRASQELNFHGEAAPVRSVMSPVRSNTHYSFDEVGLTRTETNTGETHTPVLIAKDVGKGLGKGVKPILRLTSNMWYAATLGLRNAPRLYGDKTVRPPFDPIQDVASGLQVAGTEFIFGVYDGVTGVVRIPYKDVREGDHGAMSLPLGVVRGLGGLAIKPLAGTMGLMAYSGKGVQMSLRKRFRDTRKTERWIRKARMAQGALAVQNYRFQVTAGRRVPADPTREAELERLRTQAMNLWSKGMAGMDEDEDAFKFSRRPSEPTSKKDKSRKSKTF